MTALLTPAEAAAQIGVCTKTLHKLRERGLIHYVAVTDRKIMYRPQDCEAYLESRVRRGAQQWPTNSTGKPRRGPAARSGKIIPFTARRAASGR